MNEAAAEYFEPENTLIKKTGTGGLPSETLNAIQGRIEAMTVEVTPFLKDKIQSIKDQIYSDSFIEQTTLETTSGFLPDLVAFTVNAKLTKNNGLIHISSQVLKFVERAENMNMDFYHVVKAHINALDIILKKDLNAANHPIIQALITELDDACERYNQKYKVNMTA